jgi:chromosome segregation ATPase
MTEDQLLQEQRSRQELEQELHQQKNLILTLTAQMNTLQSSLNSDTTALHQLTKHLDTHDRRMEEFTQETVGKVRLHENFIKQIMADITTRTKYGEESRRSDDARFKALNEELQSMSNVTQTETLIN